LNGTGVEFGQAGVQALGGPQFGAGQRHLAFFRKQLCLNVVRFGAGRVVGQHFRDHLLGLIQMAVLGCLINLMHGRIGRLREARRSDGKGRADSNRSGGQN
jgi:hypothetical protein